MAERENQSPDADRDKKRRLSAANDNSSAGGSVHFQTAHSRSVFAAKDKETPACPRAANDDCALVPANDNDVLVTDDLPYPLPVLPGEADLVRRLLGERFRQLMLGEDR